MKEEYVVSAGSLIGFMRGRRHGWEVLIAGEWLPLVRVRKVRYRERTTIVFLRDDEEESIQASWSGWVAVRG